MAGNYKTSILYCFIALFLAMASQAQKNTEQKDIIDPVCGKKIDKSESFDWKYADKTYYFDSYECRKTFMHNPQKFLLSSCTPDKINIDPVCGMKVNMDESYKRKYNGKTYYFDSFECKETFIENPKKFLDNKCAPPDSLK